MIAAILLVPEEGDPLGLLKEGPCGARPPIALSLRITGDSIDLDADPRWLAYDAVPDRLMACTNAEILHSLHSPRALVLKWDGEPVAEGCLRLRQAWPWTTLNHWMAIAAETGLGAFPQWDFPGTLVLLDAEGRTLVLP